MIGEDISKRRENHVNQGCWVILQRTEPREELRQGREIFPIRCDRKDNLGSKRTFSSRKSMGHSKRFRKVFLFKSLVGGLSNTALYSNKRL